MKVNELFDIEAVDVFGSQEEAEPIEFDFDDVEMDYYVRNPFYPSHADIEPGRMVDLVQDGNLIISLPWRDMQAYLDEKFDSLNGTYIISANGQVIHQFTISRRDPL